MVQRKQAVTDRGISMDVEALRGVPVYKVAKRICFPCSLADWRPLLGKLPVCEEHYAELQRALVNEGGVIEDTPTRQRAQNW